MKKSPQRSEMMARNEDGQNCFSRIEC